MEAYPSHVTAGPGKLVIVVRLGHFCHSHVRLLADLSQPLLMLYKFRALRISD